MVKDNVRKNVSSSDYTHHESEVLKHFLDSPIPDGELLENLFMFLTPQHMRRLFFWYELYQEILEVPGCIMQFGVRWGRDMAVWEALRTTFEPFNHSRKVIGFDTFEGFVGTDEKDGAHEMIQEGNFATTSGYEERLHDYLRHREGLSPLGHVQKFELHKGDACQTLPAYLEAHPETVVSLVHFDMDIYKPTVECLKMLKPYLTKGSIVVLDEAVCPAFPGETVALKEVFDLNSIRLKRHSKVGPTWPAYFVIE